jgi:hypothetical protein
MIKVGKKNGNDVLKEMGGTLYWVGMVPGETKMSN